jgi:transcriptional regulator with XRE-family HTH domain
MFVRMGNIWEQRFGRRVKDLRQARGWTQEEFARHMTAAGHSMHQTTVAKMESGARPTTIKELAAIATIFDISVAALFEDPLEETAMRQRLAGLAYRLAGISNEKNRLVDRIAELQAEWTSTEIEYKELAYQIATREQQREEEQTRLNAESENREK